MIIINNNIFYVIILGIHLSDGTIDDSKTGSDYWREIAYKLVTRHYTVLHHG